jgi:hypothetical protein
MHVAVNIRKNLPADIVTQYETLCCVFSQKVPVPFPVILPLWKRYYTGGPFSYSHENDLFNTKIWLTKNTAV